MISSFDSAHWQPPCPDFEGKLDDQWWFGSYCNIHLTTHANHFQPSGLILMLIHGNFSMLLALTMILNLLLLIKLFMYLILMHKPHSAVFMLKRVVWLQCHQEKIVTCHIMPGIILIALQVCRKKFLSMLNWNSKLVFIHVHSSHKSLVMH